MADDTALELRWTQVSDAKGYDIFLGKADGQYMDFYRGVSAYVTRSRITGLEKGVAYKACVRAWKETDGNTDFIGSASPVVFAITGGYNDQFCNPGSVSLDNTSVTLDSGKTYRIKGSVKGVKPGMQMKNYANDLRYFSSNTGVATVSASGKITAHGPGKCRIYVIATNGVRKSVKVTVKSQIPNPSQYNVRPSVVFIDTTGGRTAVFQPYFTQMTCFPSVLNL